VAFKVETSDYSTATTTVGPALDAVMTAPSGGGGAPPFLALLQANANFAAVTGVARYAPVTYLAPPPSPPPPPPLCGNGVLDPGETCDEGFGPRFGRPQSAACDSSCQFDALYACADWTATNCTCSNPAGVFAVAEITPENGAAAGGCAQTPCDLYPDRCLAAGAGCVEGSWRTGCIACKVGYYRSGGRCKVCGDNTAASAAVVAFFTVVAGLVGYRAAQILDNTSTALIKGVVSTMQYVSINVDVNIRWPDEIVAIGRWFSSVNLNIDIIAPECVSGNFNWYYIFWTGAVVVPATLVVILTLRQQYLRRAYVRTVVSIDNDDEGYFIHRRRAYLSCVVFGRRGERKLFHSPDGGLVVAELQRQYKKRVAVRTFGVLALTVMYLPIVRLCLQSYECVHHGDGYVLTHDTDLPCDAPFHRVTQAVASLILLVVGLGVPFAVLFRVRAIRVNRALDGARELTSWGALYDIYRRPIDVDDAEGRDASLASDDTKQLAKDSHAEATHASAPTRFDRVSALLAVHYLTVELLQKFVVVVCTSPRSADVAAGLLVVVYAVFAAYVHVTQPWRAITLKVCGYVVPNALNRIETLAFALQSVVVVVPWAMNGAASGAATGLLTSIICVLLFVRAALFVSERLSFLRERSTDAGVANDPVEARRRASERMLKLALKGDETRVFALKAKLVRTRNRTKARYEATRDAIVLRATSGQGNRAMLSLAKRMMESSKKLDPGEASRVDVETRVSNVLQTLDTHRVVESEDSRASDSLELTRLIAAHQRATHELVKMAQEYADAERVPELLRVAEEINGLKHAVSTLPNELGARESDALMTMLASDACLGAIHRAVVGGDATAFADALVLAGEETAKFEDWCERESDKLAATLDDNDSIAIEKDMLRAAQTALATRSSSTTTRARGFVDAWKSLATDFSTNKWNAAVSAVRKHNDELARASLVNDFDATERAFNAAHDEVEAFVSWCEASKAVFANGLMIDSKGNATTTKVSANSGVVDIATHAIACLDTRAARAKDTNAGIRRVAETGAEDSSSKTTSRRRPRGRFSNNDALHA